MAPKFGAALNSPVAIVGIAGAGLLGAVYIFSKNRPGSETVGGTLPWSLDSLANWLKGTEGGPGIPDPTLPSPTPYPDCQTQGCPEGQVCTAIGCVGIPVPLPGPGPLPCIPGDPCNPGPIPRPGPCGGETGIPCPQPTALSGRWGFFDQMETEQAHIPDVGGGQPRAYGLDMATLAAQQYSRVFAFQQTDRPEESSYGAAH